MNIYEFVLEDMREYSSSSWLGAVVIAESEETALNLLTEAYGRDRKLEDHYGIELKLIGLALDDQWPRVVSIDWACGPGA